MATMAVSRIVRPGCKSGFACNCAPMSGEAFTNAQDSPPLTAIDDCVRARARNVPARRPLQLGQLQFHWGNPPPAADPNTRIFTKKWAPPANADERPRLFQRLDTYIVISMPNRNSTACGVSHVMTNLQ